ncbi:MAG: adenosylmethionine--8-amino-7-oxononanoate transaminase [Candidatus Gastranaerophilales bacterium]|nr:adenosylmethionine--8-amino-7-oxononanoate transaminase [Candidatus Gastranaerophilales bacterium]
MDKEGIIKKDFETVWHPFTQMKELEEDKPIVIEKGEGIYLYDIDSNRYIDAVSSWWVNTLGHCNPKINKALINQVQKLEHCMFAGFTHENAVKLASELVELTDNAFTKVFYSDNGSTAVEVALKMAYQYQSQTGRAEKTKFVALKNSYHGDTLGAVSVGGVDLYHKVYKPIIFDVLQAQSPSCYRCPCSETPETCHEECFESMRNIIEENHASISSVIMEPLIQAAGGMIIYKKEYLEKLREVCDKYEIILIFDEVAVGFGRTGKLFAYQHTKVVPDIICLAKGITAGYMPLSVTLTNDKIYNAFYDDYEKNKTFYHGHSYTANALACAVAVENLRILKEDKVLESLDSKIEKFKTELAKLKDLEFVGDVRQLGMICAVELVEDKISKTPLGHDKMKRFYKNALKYGAILRPLGNVVYYLTPYIITDEQIEELCEITRKAILEI